MRYEVGKTYDVSHARKGKFRIRIAEVSGDFLAGVIVSGTAKMASGHGGEEGDEIRLSSSLITHAAEVA